MGFGGGKHLFTCCNVSYSSALLKAGILQLIQTKFWSAKNSVNGVQEQAEIPLFTCNLPVSHCMNKFQKKNPSTCTHYVQIVYDQALRLGKQSRHLVRNYEKHRLLHRRLIPCFIEQDTALFQNGYFLYCIVMW